MHPALGGTNWSEWSAIAAAAAAVGTLVLAGATFWLARRTREVSTQTGTVATQTGELVERTGDLVERTAGLVEASLREAKATESLALEARTDRQLAWQPQLELVRFNAQPAPASSADWRIRNTGAGPALGVVALARRVENVGIWTMVRIGDLVPKEQKENGSSWKDGGPSLVSPYDGVPGMATREVVVIVLLCRDVLGRRYRFAFARDAALPPGDISRRALPPQMSVRTAEHPEHIGWAGEPLIWG